VGVVELGIAGGVSDCCGGEEDGGAVEDVSECGGELLAGGKTGIGSVGGGVGRKPYWLLYKEGKCMGRCVGM